MTPPQVKPELLRWARERAGFELGPLSRRFPSLARWERGERRPTLKSIQRFARAVYVPVDTLFLPKPPIERLAIPDRRSPDNERRRRPSADLLETLEVCRGRQAWYREYAQSKGDAASNGGSRWGSQAGSQAGSQVGSQAGSQPGSGKADADVAETAAGIRRALGLSLDTQRKPPTWVDGLRRLTERIESLGVLVMSSSVVLNNNRRRLRPEEFRGFALADPIAPLVFVNAAATKAEQMFTLAHALAHLWLGQSALCDAQSAAESPEPGERWCSRLGAEILVPFDALQAEYRPAAELADEVTRLTRRFKVSPLVILARLCEAGALTAEDLARESQAEVERLRALPKGRGGNFYLSLNVRVSKRFARALVASAADGRASPADALRLLGLRKAETLQGFSQRLGVTP